MVLYWTIEFWTILNNCILIGLGEGFGEKWSVGKGCFLNSEKSHLGWVRHMILCGMYSWVLKPHRIHHCWGAEYIKFHPTSKPLPLHKIPLPCCYKQANSSFRQHGKATNSTATVNSQQSRCFLANYWVLLKYWIWESLIAPLILNCYQKESYLCGFCIMESYILMLGGSCKLQIFLYIQLTRAHSIL